ncbi:MAG TPA: hypothetical protein VN812_10455 [Candidatus Acidoferrales bacterium]|nr:hypothetical protein [Candidatus Acidoferrales bacterium]
MCQFHSRNHERNGWLLFAALAIGVSLATWSGGCKGTGIVIPTPGPGGSTPTSAMTTVAADTAKVAAGVCRKFIPQKDWPVAVSVLTTLAAQPSVDFIGAFNNAKGTAGIVGTVLGLLWTAVDLTLPIAAPSADAYLAEFEPVARAAVAGCALGIATPIVTPSPLPAPTP